jgi:DNA-3-methyladenine glycosylase
MNGCEIFTPDSGLFIEEGATVLENNVRITSRVGIQSTPEPWRSKPWRFIADISTI